MTATEPLNRLRPLLRLVAQTAELRGRAWSFDAPFEVGRMPECGLDLTGPTTLGVSRRHAAVYPDESGWHVLDRDGSNGTYHNGARIGAAPVGPLRDGDLLRFGTATVRVSFASGPMNRLRHDGRVGALVMTALAMAAQPTGLGSSHDRDQLLVLCGCCADMAHAPGCWVVDGSLGPRSPSSLLRQCGLTDPLAPGVGTVRALSVLLRHMPAGAYPLSVLTIEIDPLARADDAPPSLTADAMMLTFGKWLHEFLNESGVLTRPQCDRFTILLPGGDSVKAVAIGEQIRRAVVGGCVFDGGDGFPPLTVSVGVATLNSGLQTTANPSGPHPRCLTFDADQALLWAEGNGGNRVCLRTQDGAME